MTEQEKQIVKSMAIEEKVEILQTLPSCMLFNELIKRMTDLENRFKKIQEAMGGRQEGGETETAETIINIG